MMSKKATEYFEPVEYHREYNDNKGIDRYDYENAYRTYVRHISPDDKEYDILGAYVHGDEVVELYTEDDSKVDASRELLMKFIHNTVYMGSYDCDVCAWINFTRGGDLIPDNVEPSCYGLVDGVL